VEVFTNSPVSTTNTVNHNYPSPDGKTQLFTITVVGALLIAAMMFFSVHFCPVTPSIPPTPAPVPSPEPVPTPAPIPSPSNGFDVNISVH
jgi:hypothetical protein